MILKKEFYFVRHGLTDQNLSPDKRDHGDISLNEAGRKQAELLAPIIAKLPLETVCSSPLLRAKETKELLVPRLRGFDQEIHNLKECTAKIWNEMTSLGEDVFTLGSKTLQDFLNRAKQGVNDALMQKGPVLIVAHGGIHWAICYWMKIAGYNWQIGNCQLVHFSIDPTGSWKAKILKE